MIGQQRVNQTLVIRLPGHLKYHANFTVSAPIFRAAYMFTQVSNYLCRDVFVFFVWFSFLLGRAIPCIEIAVSQKMEPYACSASSTARNMSGCHDSLHCDALMRSLFQFGPYRICGRHKVTASQLLECTFDSVTWLSNAPLQNERSDFLSVTPSHVLETVCCTSNC